MGEMDFILREAIDKLGSQDGLKTEEYDGSDVINAIATVIFYPFWVAEPGDRIYVSAGEFDEEVFGIVGPSLMPLITDKELTVDFILGPGVSVQNKDNIIFDIIRLPTCKAYVPLSRQLNHFLQLMSKNGSNNVKKDFVIIESYHRVAEKSRDLRLVWDPTVRNIYRSNFEFVRDVNLEVEDKKDANLCLIEHSDFKGFADWIDSEALSYDPLTAEELRGLYRYYSRNIAEN